MARVLTGEMGTTKTIRIGEIEMVAVEVAARPLINSNAVTVMTTMQDIVDAVHIVGIGNQ